MFQPFLILVSEIAWWWPKWVKTYNNLLHFNENRVLPNKRVYIFDYI